MTDCFQITGEADYLVRALARDLEHYQKVITQLTRIRPVLRIQSAFVVKAVMRRAAQFIR